MRFDKDDADFEKFKKTQLYHYQNLMTKLESFLSECNISFKSLPFQADHYLENHFIKNQNIEPLKSLEIINNTGIDLTESDRELLKNCLEQQGVGNITFYNSGKTISNYEQQELEGEDDPCWKITEVVPPSSIALDKEKNYLVFNKLLEKEAGSMAYQRSDGFWNPSTQIDNKSKVDFYSKLKRKFNYLDTGEFFSIQGMNISKLSDIGEAKKISPEFQKVSIELGIKNWMRQSLVNSDFGLHITPQSFDEKQFFTIYSNPKSLSRL